MPNDGNEPETRFEIDGKFCAYLIAVLVLATVAAVVVPNLLVSIRRNHQMRNMADIRAVGTAVEAYAVEWKAYPTSGPTTAELRPFLEPKYIRSVPVTDAWGNRYAYESDSASYTIMSYGKDRAQDPVPNRGPMTRFTQDIIFSNGEFVSFPEGT